MRPAGLREGQLWQLPGTPKALRIVAIDYDDGDVTLSDPVTGAEYCGYTAEEILDGWTYQPTQAELEAAGQQTLDVDDASPACGGASDV